MEKYSVLMSVYKNDNAIYLNTAIESMVKQTVKPSQFVIVCDGPITEESDQVIRDWSEKEKELFTIIKLENNSGLANALNEGICVCSYELIARMDADDIALPFRCEKQLQMFQQYENLSICGCNIDEFFDEPSNIRTSRVVPDSYEEICKFMKRRQPFNHPTVMYRKSMLQEVGGYAQLNRKEDFDLFSRCINKGYYAMNINEALYLYRANEANYKRRQSMVNFKSALYVYKLHYKRKGCSLFDFLIISAAELIFMCLPTSIMKKLSDSILRQKK